MRSRPKRRTRPKLVRVQSGNRQIYGGIQAGAKNCRKACSRVKICMAKEGGGGVVNDGGKSDREILPTKENQHNETNATHFADTLPLDQKLE